MKSWKKLHQTIFFSVILIVFSLSLMIPSLIMASESKKGLRIMTWNIHGALGTDDKNDVNRIIKHIKDANPDILGLQEVADEEMAAKIADKLEMYYYFGPEFESEDGNALLSKYPIKESETINLPPSKGRAIIKAKININGEIWNILVTHLSLRPSEENSEQVEYIVSNVLKSFSNSVKIVLIGDFNFSPNSEQYNKLITSEKVDLIDTYGTLNQDSGLTFSSNFRVRRIDYIFSSNNLKPTSSEVICSQASDHCAVLTTF